ncbi:MAG TPA: outer membrane protein transport protein [Paludibacter sp.]|nr:outer membrane protein transport protein [Paludibacter sp.]
MKKCITILAVIIYSSLSMAQTEFDASKLLQTDISGTARYMGMAGAMGAVGSDATAIKDNPAGMGLYAHSELMVTGKMLLQKSNSNWYSGTGFFSHSNIGLNNFSFVLVPSSLKKQTKDKKDKKRKRGSSFSNNFSFSYNRLKDFNRSMYVGSDINANNVQSSISVYLEDLARNTIGFDGTGSTFGNNPWILDLANKTGLIEKKNTNPWSSILTPSESIKPSYYIKEKGAIDQYSLGWAGTYENFIHLGATVNFQTINYTAVGKYTEKYEISGALRLNDSINTKGTGISINIGAIISPTDYLRVGLSVKSPTVYTLADKSSGNMNFDRGATTSATPETPLATVNYKLQNLLQFSLSTAYLVDTRGLISAQFDYGLNSRAKLLSKDGGIDYYMHENQAMKRNISNMYTIKVGGEFNINENITARAGLAYSCSPTKKGASEYIGEVNNKRVDTQYFLGNSTLFESIGVGYHTEKWSVDVAFTNKNLKEDFYPYNSSTLADKAEAGSVKTTLNNIVISFGYKL